MVASPSLIPSRTGASFNRKKSKQDYATPLHFIQAVTSRFGNLSVDLAALPHNAKAPQFITPEQDSLKTPWEFDGLCWLNPPFANIAPWARKCAEAGSRGIKVAFLVPAAVGANWFRDSVHNKAHVLFLNGRIDFIPGEPYPKDCILALFGENAGYDVWTWKGGAR